MINTSKSNLTKVETLLSEVGYTIRYEKGSFRSGYCLVEDRKIIVINKFFDLEGRINTLIDIISTINIDPTILSEKSKKMFGVIQKQINEAGNI